MSGHRKTGVHLKGPFKIKRVRKHYGKQEKVTVEIPYYHPSPDDQSLRHFGYTLVSPGEKAAPVAPESSFSKE